MRSNLRLFFVSSVLAGSSVVACGGGTTATVRESSTSDVTGNAASDSTSARPSDQPASCSLPAETGPCKAALERWAYDSATDRCEAFVYGGCKGNENNFPSEEQCLQSCTAMPAPPSDRPAICSLPAATGPCKALFERWAYNSAAGRCESFVYGGCEGNENNFTSEEQCLQSCKR